MADEALPARDSTESAGATPRPFTADDESALRDSLKRCSAATVEAAVDYRKTKDVQLLPVIVMGVIERFVEPDLRAKLKHADDDIRLVEDLGVDSLTMMEIVILVEEALQLQIHNEELRNLRTAGDIKAFIDCKARGLPTPQPTRFLPLEQVASVMPIQPPFLFLNEATITSDGAQAKFLITGQELFLQGHFKDNPVMPASMMLEALGQLAVLFLIEGMSTDDGRKIDPTKIFFTSCEGVRCHRVCRPGDLLNLSIKPKRAKMPLATFEGVIRVGQEKAALAEEITLTFGYVETAVDPATLPGTQAGAAARANAAAASPLTAAVSTA